MGYFGNRPAPAGEGFKATIYEKVTAAIIDSMESNPGKWQMPWHRPAGDTGLGFGLPVNVITKKAYRGGNVLLLWGAQKGLIWATYNQWQSIGAQVRRGERGTACVKWSPIDTVDKVTGKKGVRLIPKGFTVFAACQVDGYTAPEEPKVTAKDLTKRLKRADSVILDYQARAKVTETHEGTRAAYSPSRHAIVMPPRKLFKGTATSTATEAYYSTRLHEHSHSTGAKHLLDRTLSVNMSSDDYAFEELVAELSSAFLCAALGVSNSPRADHAQYLAGWLKRLKADDRAIFRAASQAQKAADLILPPEPEKAPD